MNRRNFGKILLSLPLAIVLLTFVKVSASPPHFDFTIQSHHLIVEIDPARHFLKAEDRLEVTRPGRAQSLSLLLHPRLKVTRIADQATGQPLPWSETPFSARARRLDISIQKAEDPLLLSISYEGPIYDPIQKERELQFVRGDQTTGLIGPEGVYLSSATYWYPDRPDSTARYEIEVSIQDPFRIVTQGELVSENLKEGIWRSKWVNALPDESLTLVAGKYSVRTKKSNGIKISTYFFHEDEKLAETFLNAAEEYLKIYSGLLGPYPYKKFDIVQNFFSSGYGFPTFTLLSPEAIRQGKEFLRPGALDHEIVHSWWGHYVSVKPGTGNWVEALTTYCSNYYYKELKMGQEAARKHRADVLQKYAMEVPPSKDYPLWKFEGKDTDLDAQIGYGKGSMVFHMLRRIVGKDLFFSTLKKFAAQYGGKQASWEDIRKAFEEANGKRLDWFFSEWLDRTGGPQLKLENVKLQNTTNGYTVSGEVVQEGDVYQFLLPVEVDEGPGKRRLFLEVSKRRTFFSMEVPRTPLKLTLDPESHLFRRHYPEEIVPGLNAMLEDREKIIVVSDQVDEESKKIYLDLAKRVKEQKGGETLSAREVTEERLGGSSVMLLGETWRNPVFAKLLSGLPKPIDRKEGSFFLKGEKLAESDESLLVTFSNPLQPGKWVTLYFGRSAAALSRARYIFFYGWDSFILFKGGRPKERGNFPPRSSFVSFDFISKDHLAKIETKRLKEHVSYLASPEAAGRFPGTSGYQKTRTYLIKQLEEMGITPVFQPFSLTVRDIGQSTSILKTQNREEKLKSVPFRFSKNGKWEGPFTLIGQSQNDELENLSGRGAIIFLDIAKDFRYEQLLKKIRELQSRGAKAILFLTREEDIDPLAPYITYPSYFPPKLGEKLNKREKGASPPQRLIEVSKLASRVKEPDFSIKIPVLFVFYRQLEEGWTKDILDQKNVSFEVSLQFKEVRVKDENIGGIIEGYDPKKKTEFLVLGAHYDQLGKDDISGFYYSGADDNATGVSALLEIGRSLVKKKASFKRSVLLLFFGGEEWGLRGSHHFVNHPFVPLAQIRGMYSLDTIGGATDEKEVFLIGSSFHPSLAQKSRRFMEPLGIKEGKNVDQHSFEYGSDHYSFHLKGIPALSFFASDYKKIHTSRDNVESINFEKLADVTKLIFLTANEFLTEP